MFAVQFDIASRLWRSLLGISVQLVDPATLKPETITIGLSPLEDSHTATYIQIKIKECLQSYGLCESQVYSYTTDKGKNVLKATRDLLKDTMELIVCDNDDVEEEYETNDQTPPAADEAQIRCAAHTVQLAVHDFLRPYENKLHNIQEAVREMRVTLKKNGHRLPALSNITRWSSTYRMLKRVLDAKPHVVADYPLLEWDLIQELVDALKAVAELTTRMQAEKYLMGDFYRDQFLCQKAVSKLTSVCAVSLAECLETRMVPLNQTMTFLAAILCDPRFNTTNSRVIDDEQRAEATVSQLIKYKAN